MSRSALQKIYDDPAVVHAMYVLAQHGIVTGWKYEELVRISSIADKEADQ